MSNIENKTFYQRIKETFSLKLPFYLFACALIIALSAFSCEEEETEIIECFVGDTFTSEVTVKEVICGEGLWGNKWLDANLEPVDGFPHYLQPYSMDAALAEEFAKYNYAIEDGMKFEIEYRCVESDGRYNDVIICAAYVGEKIPIEIISIRDIPTNDNQ